MEIFHNSNIIWKICLYCRYDILIKLNNAIADLISIDEDKTKLP